MIVKVSHKQKELRRIKENGKFFELYNTGLTSLDSIVRIVKGYPLFIGGQVHHGKSEFSLELCISLSIQYKFKWCCYLGEAGKSEISFIEISQKIIGKNYFQFSESDIIYASQFIEEHFIILEIEDLTVQGFYEEVTRAEKELELKFDGTLFDPFNDAKNGTALHGGRTDIWLEEDLKFIRKQSAKFNRVDLVVFHVQEIKPIKDEDSGKWYSRPALPTEWAGGQVVHRRAFTQLLVYKLPEWMKDENGIPYGENRTMVLNQKAKPKGSGTIGRVIFVWDWKANRYYEDVDGFKKYMLDKYTQQITPQMPINVDFDNLINDNQPF